MSQRTIKKIIELPEGDVRKFDSLYPQHGAFTWFMREALHRFVTLHEISSTDLIQEAVAEINIKDS